MQDPPGRQDTPSAGLTAAGEAIAAGITGRWLRAVSQFGLISRAAVYLLVGYLGLRLALAVHGRAAEPVSGARAVQEAAATPGVRRRCCCSPPDSPATRSPSSSKRYFAPDTPVADSAGGVSGHSRRGMPFVLGILC